MTSSRTFRALPTSVRDARLFVEKSIGDVDEDALGAIMVMVSELATNCVRHAATEFTVRVEGFPGKVRVEVTDGGSGEPVLRHPDWGEPRGRGLLVVEQFSDEWGVIRGDGPGKMVWFSLNLAPPATVQAKSLRVVQGCSSSPTPAER